MTTIYNDLPETIDCEKQYVFYLHGLIVEKAGIRPYNEEHGYYEYEKIVAALAGLGAVVISEVRPDGTEILPYSEKVCSQITTLLERGVPAENIMVVGASKGGVIASYVSSTLKNMELFFVFLSGLFEDCLKDEQLTLYGNVLSIHDSSDTLSITPELYFKRSEGMGSFKQLTLDLNLGHGLIYQPRPEWLEPIAAMMTK